VAGPGPDVTGAILGSGTCGKVTQGEIGMKAIKICALAIIVVLFGSWVMLRTFTVDIPVGRVGVRTQQYGVPLLGDKGVFTKDFGSGWHRDLGPIDSWEIFDSTVQTLEMTRDPQHGSETGRDDVQVQSADGYAVSVDVTVKYRIQEGMAHQLYQDTGSGTKYQTIVRNEAQQACMGFFGQMSTEDFYNSQVRRQKAEEVKTLLVESLTDNFVEVIDVLIRDVQFDPEYEDKIRSKKLADQEVEVNKSMAKAEEKKGERLVVEAATERKVKVIEEEKKAQLIRMEAEADLKIATITAEAEKYAMEKKADADLIEAENKAKGELLVKTAEAEGEKLRNQAMVGVGGSTIVALEAAKNLKFSNMTISTMDVDVLDIDKMATKLGIAEAKK